MAVLIDEAYMTALQRIQDFINAELQALADEYREEIVAAQYQDYIDDMYLAQASYYGYDDLDSEWD